MEAVDAGVGLRRHPDLLAEAGREASRGQAGGVPQRADRDVAPAPADTLGDPRDRRIDGWRPSETRLDPRRRRRQAGARVAGRGVAAIRESDGLGADEIAEVDVLSGQFVQRPAQQAPGAFRRELDAQHGRRAWRRFDDEGLRLLPAHDQRRAALDAAVAHHAVACIEVHDELQQAGREHPLARMGGAAGEVPEALDRVAQVGRPPLDGVQQPSSPSTRWVRYDTASMLPGRGPPRAFGCASRAPACMVSALERVKSGVHTGGHTGDGPNVASARDHGGPRVRADRTPRHVVGNSAGSVPGVLDLHRLRDVGRVPGRALHLRAVSLAVLLAGDLRHLAALVVRAVPGLVAGVHPGLAGAADPAHPRRVPLHLLLLPRRLLQGVLGRPAVVRGR